MWGEWEGGNPWSLAHEAYGAGLGDRQLKSQHEDANVGTEIEQQMLSKIDKIRIPWPHDPLIA